MNRGKIKIQLNLTAPLFLIFLVLKLTHVIAWSWFWIFSPLFIPLAFWLLVVIIIALAELT